MESRKEEKYPRKVEDSGNKSVPFDVNSILQQATDRYASLKQNEIDENQRGGNLRNSSETEKSKKSDQNEKFTKYSGTPKDTDFNSKQSSEKRPIQYPHSNQDDFTNFSSMKLSQQNQEQIKNNSLQSHEKPTKSPRPKDDFQMFGPKGQEKAKSPSSKQEGFKTKLLQYNQEDLKSQEKPTKSPRPHQEDFKRNSSQSHEKQTKSPRPNQENLQKFAPKGEEKVAAKSPRSKQEDSNTKPLQHNQGDLKSQEKPTKSPRPHQEDFKRNSSQSYEKPTKSPRTNQFPNSGKVTKSPLHPSEELKNTSLKNEERQRTKSPHQKPTNTDDRPPSKNKVLDKQEHLKNGDPYLKNLSKFDDMLGDKNSYSKDIQQEEQKEIGRKELSNRNQDIQNDDREKIVNKIKE